MRERAVVITGIGLTSPLGKDVEENWNNVKKMQTGIAHYPNYGLPNFMQYLGKINDFKMPDDIPDKLIGQKKFLNRGATLGFVASCEAMSQSGFHPSEVPPGRRALYVASGDLTTIGYDFMYPAIKDGTDKNWHGMDYEKLNKAALNKVNPFFLLESLSNNLFSFLSAFLEFMGPNTSLASLFPCGGTALELAYRSIKQDRADVALATGSGNWITEMPLYELEGLGILSKCDTGINSYKPFERHRDGFIPGEGGATIFMEAAEVATKRGANILGRIRGCGNCIEFSPNQRVGVPPKISKRSMLSAIEEACCDINDLSLITPHGSGTQKGDRSELRSIMGILDNKKADIPICGLKPYTGHMGAASDIAEVILGINALTDRTAPATLNFKETEKEFADLRISNSFQTLEGNNFLSTSYGILGQSSSVVVEVSL